MLGRSDLPAAIRVLSANPVENVFVASRVRAAGLEQASLGCPVWGYERDGALRALCHAGSNLVPVNADEAAIEAWTEFAGPQRMCASIIGPSHGGAGAVAPAVRPLGPGLERGAQRPAAPAGDVDQHRAPVAPSTTGSAGSPWTTGTPTPTPR